ncbi:hypothetical protein GCM10027176_45770 [Actinoallomurus bryophytorum]|uniref:Uncharacterized protein n=1 Tax=Actinoallomurus bryophytorum TaxID=1490222 RepID=A0A543CCH1_9ACTN|nr:hypothetical protein [Actinoallomurus bryophytorum]TQL94771.1 hypothetical protein FB559_0253 [Actinoallomurus bryophytorum]
MTALDRVAWGEVLGDLLTASPREVRAAAARCVARSTFLGLGPMTLAVLALQMSPGTVRRALSDHATLDVDGIDRTLIWLHEAARLALATVQPPAPARPFPPGVVADVDPELYGLPLLEAAVEHARATTGRLGVYLADLGPAISGRCTYRAHVDVDGQQAEAIVIELTAGHTTGQWLHELGHALDPRRDPRTSEEAEAYADRLAEGLGALAPRASYGLVRAQAEETYSEVRAAFQRHRHAPVEHAQEEGVISSDAPDKAGADWPAPGLMSLLAFASLPLVAT